MTIKTLTKVSLFALALGAAGPALGADLGGSFKDDAPERTQRLTRSGFTITGLLGYAWGDRDITHTVNREKGIYSEFTPPAEATYDTDGTAGLSETEKAAFDEATAEFNEGIGEVLAKWKGSAYDGNTLTLPIASDVLTNKGTDDIGSLVYGAELGYMFHGGGRFALEPAIGVTFYDDAFSKISHKNKLGTSTGLIDPAEFIDPEHLTQTGEASVDRKMDVDLLVRGYVYANERLAFTIAGGVSFAFADVCGRNVTDATVSNPELQSLINAAFNTSHCDEDVSIGPMLEGGFKYHLSDNWSVVGRADIKWHEFESSGGSLKKLQLNEAGSRVPVGIYGKSDSKVEADDTLWTVKAGVTYTFD